MLAVTKGYEVRANMYVYLKGVIDVENPFQNCARESEKAVLVPVSTEGITADHERGNWIKQLIQYTRLAVVT